MTINKVSAEHHEQQQQPCGAAAAANSSSFSQVGGEDESVTDLYTTDGTTALGAILGKGSVTNDDDEVYLDAGGRLSDEAFREQVRLEQERIFRDYQLEVPTTHPFAVDPTNNANDDDSEIDDESLLTNTIDGDADVSAVPPNSSNEKGATGVDLDARSVLTNNSIFRATMEAEERRLMAEFDFDYSVKSSFDDQFDVAAIPGDSSSAAASGGGPTQNAILRTTALYPPLAPSVATEAEDMDATSTLPDFSLIEGQGGATHGVVVLTVGDDEEEGGNGNLAGSGIAGGAHPPTKSASSSLSSFRSMPFMNTLRILLPSSVVGAATSSGAAQSRSRRSNNNVDPAFVGDKPTPATNSSGASDSSPTSKTHTHTATDSKPNHTHSPSRSGDSPSSHAAANPRVPPSIIILGTIDRDDIDDDPNDVTLGDHEAEEGLRVVKSMSKANEEGGGPIHKVARRLWGDWLRRVIVLLVLAMLMSIGVAVGGLVVYRNNQAAAAAAAASSPDVNNNAPPVSPPFITNNTSGNATDDFFRPPAVNSTTSNETSNETSPATNVPKPPEALSTDAPSADPVAATKKPVNTPAPTKLRATKSPTSEPSVAAPPPPQDAANATDATPAPTAAAVDATAGPTEAPSPSSTSSPSPGTSTGSPVSADAMLRSILSSVAPTSIMDRLDDGSSTAPASALSWLVQDFENYGGPDKQVVQRYTLATAAYSFQSDNWDSNSNWLDSNVNECQWYGISCDDDSNIVSIDLESNGLKGRIPPELSLLSSSLTSITLSDNSISGTFPVELTSLLYLDTLLMAENNVDGSIPTEVGTMGSLARLHLEQNSMTGSVPTQVGLLTSLQEFYIWGNDFTGVASDVCDLSGLDFMIDCDLKDQVDCYTRCYYTCGGSSGVPCRNRALLGNNVFYESA